MTCSTLLADKHHLLQRPPSKPQAGDRTSLQHLSHLMGYVVPFEAHKNRYLCLWLQELSSKHAMTAPDKQHDSLVCMAASLTTRGRLKSVVILQSPVEYK